MAKQDKSATVPMPNEHKSVRQMEALFLEKGSLDQNLNLRTEAELNNRFYFIFLDLSFDFGESDHGVRAGEGGAGPHAGKECCRPQG